MPTLLPGDCSPCDAAMLTLLPGDCSPCDAAMLLPGDCSPCDAAMLLSGDCSLACDAATLLPGDCSPCDTAMLLPGVGSPCDAATPALPLSLKGSPSSLLALGVSAVELAGRIDFSRKLSPQYSSKCSPAVESSSCSCCLASDSRRASSAASCWATLACRSRRASILSCSSALSSRAGTKSPRGLNFKTNSLRLAGGKSDRIDFS